jgi:histidine ammonia-lyase
VNVTLTVIVSPAITLGLLTILISLTSIVAQLARRGVPAVVISVPGQEHVLDVPSQALTTATKNKAIAIVQRETKIFFVFIFALILFNYVESFFLQDYRVFPSL